MNESSERCALHIRILIVHHIFSPRNILCPIESVFICLALANTVKSNLKKYSVLFFSDMMSSELEKKNIPCNVKVVL